MEPNPFQVAMKVGAGLERLGVAYHLGGSLASSIHGLPRATLDADLVAEIRPGQGQGLCELLGAEFYVNAEAIEEAIRRKKSFNAIHLDTMFKVDVFVLGDSPFAQESFARSRPEPFENLGVTVRVATAEDTVLHKLLWYRKGGEASARQWGDLVGVLKVQGARLDRAYLDRWAHRLALAGLLRRALGQAGLVD